MNTSIEHFLARVWLGNTYERWGIALSVVIVATISMVVVRKIVAMRKKDQSALLEEQAILSTYLQALGMLGQIADLPLGQAAIGSAPKASGAPQEAIAAISAKHETDMARARERAYEAVDDKKQRIENPYRHEDPRWYAWDEAFAEASRLVAA